MRRTGLDLQTVSAACMVAAGRLSRGSPWAPLRLRLMGNLQPDLVPVSRSLKRIGLVDLCRPFDSHSGLLHAARLASSAKTMRLLASSGGIAVIYGKWVAVADSPLGSGRP